MNKYYKAEDVINKVAEYISSDYPTEERAKEDVELLFADTQTIDIVRCFICNRKIVLPVIHTMQETMFCDECKKRLKNQLYTKWELEQIGGGQ